MPAGNEFVDSDAGERVEHGTLWRMNGCIWAVTTVLRSGYMSRLVRPALTPPVLPADELEESLHEQLESLSEKWDCFHAKG